MRVATLWFLAETVGIALASSGMWNHTALATSGKWNHTALATISPCPAAPTKSAPAPITVTNQHQPVSTCVPSTTCMRNSHRCRTEYSYSTWNYVSTILPCPYGDSSVSTITKTEQSVVVSRTTLTITDTTATELSYVESGAPIVSVSTATSYTTVVKEWNAMYKDLGPRAIPGYSGSGLCKACHSPDGKELQVLEVIECKNSSNIPTVCSVWPETWIYASAPTSTSTAEAVCSSHAVAPSAGDYTFAFLQWAPPATIPVPAQTITFTVPGARPTVVTTTITETITVVPAQPWTAYVTRHCTRPTIFDFETTVTETIYYTVPPFTPPGPPYVL